MLNLTVYCKQVFYSQAFYFRDIREYDLFVNIKHPVYQCFQNFVGPVGQSDIFYACQTKMLERRTKCPTENIKMSIWLTKRSETKVTIKDNN